MLGGDSASAGSESMYAIIGMPTIRPARLPYRTMYWIMVHPGCELRALNSSGPARGNRMIDRVPRSVVVRRRLAQFGIGRRIVLDPHLRAGFLEERFGLHTRRAGHRGVIVEAR